MINLINEGTVRALATGASERIEALADLPTLAESGYPELVNTDASFSIIAPVGIDDAITTTVHDAIDYCLTTPEVIERLGEDYIPTDDLSSEEIAEEYWIAAHRAAEVLDNE